MQGKMTVFFDEPFWVAVFEREDEQGYCAARHVFGAEPGDAEIHAFLLNGYQQLRFSTPYSRAAPEPAAHNYKRRQRDNRRSQNSGGSGTAAQRALKAQQEARQAERGVHRRAEKSAAELLKFEQRQQRRKEKHRGR
jgi:hypothetical protein